MGPATRSNDRTERVLVVEGDEVLRDLLLQNVTDIGYEVEVAATGTDALDALARAPFGVALIDTRVSAPGLRGVFASGRALLPWLQLVAILPFSDRDGLADALELGPLACLRMPFTVDELEPILALACRRARVARRRGGGEEAQSAAAPRPEP